MACTLDLMFRGTPFTSYNTISQNDFQPSGVLRTLRLNLHTAPPSLPSKKVKRREKRNLGGRGRDRPDGSEAACTETAQTGVRDGGGSLKTLVHVPDTQEGHPRRRMHIRVLRDTLIQKEVR
ncbi:hypothetical protein AG1IA_00645 [Rhizoctonia solani AG-1 IA]|uniref:Uncharacterized protein n=1 Tax=Thanatephorus cucumeris (strain AG1-IA) TaxID=983506 RepID=L8X8B5_THACA|nr:hypothetical protein AG1IA_00645 [Rhizoctonia solani AG-1 IA]